MLCYHVLICVIFAVDSQLDLILCLCDSLNYVIDLKDVKQAFENTYNALKKVDHLFLILILCIKWKQF